MVMMMIDDDDNEDGVHWSPRTHRVQWVSSDTCCQWARPDGPHGPPKGPWAFIMMMMIDDDDDGDDDDDEP
eukprot:3644658-Karenia_brevis.AAC.1